MLLLPVVRLMPALEPNAILLLPVVLDESACFPTAVLSVPVCAEPERTVTVPVL